METLFIADDEQAIRDGLKYIIDWEKYGFIICGEAGNGEDALNGLVSLNPSLALLDVRMPQMLGTEVIRKAREQGFTGKCIILSGYSDFTYAREAIANGVSSYITKPLDEDELLLVVQKIRDELSAQKQHNTHINEIKSKAKEVILKDLIHGENTRLTDSDIEYLKLRHDSFQVVISEAFDKNSKSPYLFSDLLKITNGESKCYEIINEDNREVILFKGPYGQHRLAGILDHYDDETQHGSALSTLFLTYGCPVSSLEDIHISYSQAKTLLGRRFFCPMEQHYMGYEECPEQSSLPEQPLDYSLINYYGEKLKDYIQIYSHQQVVNTLSDVKDYLIKTTSNTSDIKMFLLDLYWQVKENIIRVYSNADIKFPAPSSVMQFINKANYLYEIIRFLSEQCNLIMNATGNPNRDTIIDDILYYINNNFAQNIKLESLAPLFGYNSAYLGKIFHKAVGESFNTYVDHKRIEASKKMLENADLKVYEISDQIGYKNVDYFHKKFKKYVGQSPAEYRKSLGQ